MFLRASSLSLSLSLSLYPVCVPCVSVPAPCRYNHGHLIRLLASLPGINLNQAEREHGYAPLTLALVLGHAWAAFELLRAGAEVRLNTDNGRTPLFVAAEKGLSETIRIMVEERGVSECG